MSKHALEDLVSADLVFNAELDDAQAAITYASASGSVGSTYNNGPSSVTVARVASHPAAWRLVDVTAFGASGDPGIVLVREGHPGRYRSHAA